MTRFASRLAPSSVLALGLAALSLACGEPDPIPPADAGTDAPPDAFVYVPPDAGPPDPISFGALGSLETAAGEGSFRFGVSTAATQIEDMNTATDWYAFTAPEPEGLGRGVFVGDAVRGYTHAVADVALLRELAVDSYRFSVEWARVEPRRDEVDDAALAHYGALLDALLAAGIRPMITVHHFSNPTWVADPRHPAADCVAPFPNDEWLCGFGHPVGGPLIAEEAEEHACLLATTFGDRVDDWGTINEPVNYLFASYGAGVFPPGRVLLGDGEAFLDVVRGALDMHAAIYRGIARCDTGDADGDGDAASIGVPLSVADWVPAYQNAPSAREADVAAAARVRYVYHFLFVESVLNGTFDGDLDGTPDETHPEWAATIDWLGVQYYFRAGVTASPAFIRLVGATPCTNGLDSGSCIDPPDPTHWVPSMHYEYYEPGLAEILLEYHERFPDLPLVVTEAGIATEVGARRAENVVRTLEQIAHARALGADVRGYYHWSFMDNFEWAEGYEPRFGLYRVDRTGEYPRTITEGGTVYSEIAASRGLTMEQRVRYGGLGPMTPEP